MTPRARTESLIPWEEARARVLASIHPLPPMRSAVLESLGLAVAEGVRAPRAMPPFDNSAVDGFAVRAADVGHASLQAPVRLRVAGARVAGTAVPLFVQAGETVRLMTGAPMPEGADAVVMIEDTDAWDARPEPGATETAHPARDPENWVEIRRAALPGDHLRRAGESVAAGAVILEAGHLLRPAEIGLLISVGVGYLLVHPLPRVAVLSTGDELVRPGEEPGPGRIPDSNRPALLAALRHRGFPAVDLGLVPDDEDALAQAVLHGVQKADFLITSGGVSVGDRDFTHRVLSRLGQVQVMKVAMKPGKPQLFGRVGETPVYGLPGNPVSSLVVFEEFVLPALRKMAGRKELLRPAFSARLEAPIRRKSGRTEFLRVRLTVEDGSWVARVTGPQGSGVLSSMTQANGYAILPPDAGDLEAGETVSCRLWDE